jgi:hypothetical protein
MTFRATRGLRLRPGPSAIPVIIGAEASPASHSCDVPSVLAPRKLWCRTEQGSCSGSNRHCDSSPECNPRSSSVLWIESSTGPRYPSGQGGQLPVF